MKDKRDGFRLGLAVIVMFVLFVACLIFVGGRGLFQERTRQLTVRFQAGPGMPEIVAGSRVVCFGQGVGKVIATHFVDGIVPDDPEKTKTQFLEVTATALEALDLRRDCKVIASGPPLGGKGMLEIANRGVDAKPLPEDWALYGETAGFQTALTQLNHELDAKNPEGLLAMIKGQLDRTNRDSVIARIHASLVDINAMTASLARELDRDHEDRLLFKLDSGLDTINQGLAELSGILAENRAPLGRTVTSLDHAMGVIDTDIVVPLADEFDPAQPTSLLGRVHGAFDHLNRSLADLNAITGKTNEVLVLNADRVDELVANTTEASALLKTGVRDVMLHPWKVFFQPTASEKRELNILEVAREFADASSSLDDASTRLKALIEARGNQLAPDDAELLDIRSRLTKSVDQFFKAEQALWRELKVAQ